MSEFFKLRSLGIDTSPSSLKTIETITGSKGNYSYICVSPSTFDISGKDVCQRNPFLYLAVKLRLVEASFSAELIKHILVQSKRDSIAVLYIEEYEKWPIDILKSLLKSKVVKEIAPYNPINLDAISDLEKELGTMIRTVGLEFGPENYSPVLLEDIKKKGLKLHGFNPLGMPYHCSRLISKYGQEYLLAFMAAISDTVFLNSEDPVRVIDAENYLASLTGDKIPDIIKEVGGVGVLPEKEETAIHKFIPILPGMNVRTEAKFVGFSDSVFMKAAGEEKPVWKNSKVLVDYLKKIEERQNPIVKYLRTRLQEISQKDDFPSSDPDLAWTLLRTSISSFIEDYFKNEVDKTLPGTVTNWSVGYDYPIYELLQIDLVFDEVRLDDKVEKKKKFFPSLKKKVRSVAHWEELFLAFNRDTSEWVIWCTEKQNPESK